MTFFPYAESEYNIGFVYAVGYQGPKIYVVQDIQKVKKGNIIIIKYQV